MTEKLPTRDEVFNELSRYCGHMRKAGFLDVRLLEANNTMWISTRDPRDERRDCGRPVRYMESTNLKQKNSR